MRAIHLPGHTRGHCALLAEPAGVLFLGDIDLTGFGPYYGDAWSCLEDFERSLARVRELPARVWVSFHHAGVITERSEFLAKLDRFAGRIAERERALLDFLAAPRTLDGDGRPSLPLPAARPALVHRRRRAAHDPPAPRSARRAGARRRVRDARWVRRRESPLQPPQTHRADVGVCT